MSDTLTDLAALPAEVTEHTLTLARMLAAHPNAARALQRSIERQREARAKAEQDVAVNTDCPYCLAPAIHYLTLPGKNGPRNFYRRPVDCCDHARRDAAENALHYALNPNNEPAERIESADLYAALKESITTPELLRELETHELLLADIEQRVGKLTRAQGGVEHGRSGA